VIESSGRASDLLPAAVRPGSAALPRWKRIRERGTDLGWVLLGRVTLAGANALVMLALAQALSVPMYGLFVTVVGGQILLSRLMLLGVDHGMTRLRTMPDLRPRAREVELAALLVVVRSAAAVAAAGALMFAAGAAAKWWDSPAWVAAAVLAGAVGMSLFDYACGYRMARFEYRAGGLLQVVMPALRAAATLLALWAFQARPEPLFLAYAGAGLLFGLAVTVGHLRGRKVRPEEGLIRRVASFSAWKAGSDLVYALNLYQGVFLLQALDRERDTGLFGLALSAALGLMVLKNAVGDFLFSRLVKVKSAEALPRFFGRLSVVTLGMAAACAPAVIAAGVLGSRLLKPELLPAIPLFYLLSGAVLLLMLQGLLDDLCLYLLRPHLLLTGAVIRVAGVGALGLALAPAAGAHGAAVAQVAGTAVGLALSMVLASRAWRAASRNKPGLAPAFGQEVRS
jgi:O-antigen/teichoic acid export membrane protein